MQFTGQRKPTTARCGHAFRRARHWPAASARSTNPTRYAFRWVWWRTNLWVGWLLAWFIFMPLSTFTELHRWHHGFLGDAKRDPDEWFYLGGPRQLFLRECLFMPRFVWLSLTSWPLSAQARGWVRRELAANALLWALAASGLVLLDRIDVLLWGCAVPMLWLGLVFNPISRGYEHFPMACMSESDPGRKDLCRNTITVTSPLVAWAWVNITFHVTVSGEFQM